MLDRKIVLVTGASSGIGRAIALGCARAGADVALTYRDNQDISHQSNEAQHCGLSVLCAPHAYSGAS